MNELRKAVAQAVSSLGFCQEDQAKLTMPLVHFLGSLNGVHGVLGVEVGFRRIPDGYMRTFGDFPGVGVFEVVTVVRGKDWTKVEDRITYYELVGREDRLMKLHRQVPVEFHIGPKDRFPARTSFDIFKRLVPETTEHILTLSLEG